MAGVGHQRTVVPRRALPRSVLHIPLWFIRELKGVEWGEYSKPCRNAWLPALTAAGVRVVISGHTHDFAWMPAKDGQPLNQLIGGGPKPQHATIIHGTATRETLTLKMSKLDGKLLYEIKLTA